MTTRTQFLLLATTSMLAITGLGACSKAPEPLPTPAVSSAASSAGVEVSDLDVTEHVKTALLQSDVLKGFDITVATTKGDVRLKGVLDSQLQIDEALRIARAADGTHAIHDELTIKK